MVRKTIEPVRDSVDVSRLVEELCESVGLACTLRTTTKSYPGSTHWHYKRDSARGTLEITWWPAGRRLWISSRAGRDADWIPGAMERLAAELQTKIV